MQNMERDRRKSKQPDRYKPENNKEKDTYSDDELESNSNPIDLEVESDKEQEFDLDEKVAINNIESYQNNNEDDSFISKTDDYQELSNGKTTLESMYLEASLGSGNKLQRALIVREIAHHKVLDDKSDNEDYSPVTLEEIKEDEPQIQNDIDIAIHNNITSVQNNTTYNITSNNNNTNNTTINYHHHYHTPPIQPPPVQSIVFTQSGHQANVSSASNDNYTIPRKQRKIQKVQHISPILEFEEKYKQINSELNWAIEYRRACRGYNARWINQQNSTLKGKEGILNEEKRKLMDMLP
jgi:hypothetical protein